MRILVFALLLSALMIVAVASADDPNFRVRTSSSAPATFGKFVDARVDPPRALEEMQSVFGAPDSVTRDTRLGVCKATWNGLGIRARFTNFDSKNLDVCAVFQQAKLTDKRWHTSKVSVGDSERRAREAAVSCRSPRCSTLGAPAGYALGTRSVECASRDVPTVLATVKDKRVSALYVFTDGCVWRGLTAQSAP